MPWLVLRMLALKSWLSSRTKSLTTKPVRVGIFALVASFLFRAAPANAQSLDTDTILQAFAEFAYSIAATITKLIVLLIDIMVPIMTYNNFVGNPVVKAGWAIVRDTVNMFFVVILIIIAFGTIFGAERFKWQQQVPRLLTMAIVVNFSKTLSGIMIDFGQVIMLTFANALREIAAGNFIQLLGLNEIYSVSQSSSIITSIQEDGGQGASQAFDFFASGIASVLLTLWVLATLVIMVAILLFRIIMLWVLIVIAPLAWFMKGAKGIIDSSAYEDWWKEFKCLVGIGPILAFFLWLTLAVAGAGNIAANSGFNVSADSNNANFTSSLLEVNNFLSFLIGMAMLFAGFKAASQFCSAGIAGGFIGKRLDTAKAFSPEKVAKLAAGAGLKVGGYGARLGARGVAAIPGGVTAASRYLPPSVRNIPNKINPLNAQRRAALSGKVGGVFGDTAAGRYFKGKQADLELGVRSKKFEGVNKEKEAMKDKSRDWKKGQIESMLKSPPMTQAGQDAQTALFEEMMGDKRLQKELGRDKVQELWKSQGGKYKNMAKGNAAKSADLETFEKANADFTGSSHLIKDAEDTKGLAAGAWQDKAVQDRAGNIQTTYKKGNQALTALEAAREGFYGVDAQKAAVKGADVAKMDVGKQMEDQFALALTHEDKESADKVVAQIETKYKDAGTSDQDREKIARSMDRMRAAAAQMAKGGNTTAAGSLSSFDLARKGMEAKVGFGLPPVPGEGQSSKDYVRENFGGSNGERIDAAIKQVGDAKKGDQKNLDALESEMASLTGSEQAERKQIEAKRRQIEATKKRIEGTIQPEVDKAWADLRAAKQLLAEAERRKPQAVADARAKVQGLEAQYLKDPSSAEGQKLIPQIKAAQQKLKEAESGTEVENGRTYVAEMTASYANAKSRLASETTNDSEVVALEKELNDLVATAAGSSRSVEAKQKSEQVQELRERVSRLKETQKRLEEERKKRG